MKKILVALSNINLYELFSNLLIVLLVGHGYLRSWDWITMTTDKLEKISPLYITISYYLDIHALGWLFVVFSTLLMISLFFKGQVGLIFLVMGSIGAGVIHLIFGLISTEGATLFVTYYLNLLCGVIQIIISAFGGIQLWKVTQIKNSKL